MDQRFTLLELNKSIQEEISSAFPKSMWVIGEISELKVNRNGHCYLELIEKDVVTDNIIARSRATIWAFTFRMLRPYFENATGRELNPGIKILVQVKLEFHELYGLSLNITDIDPSFTIGDLALKKAEIINQLEEEGVINLNKELDFPIVPQKLAIISSETAAGYQDFINQLDNNSYGYKYYTKLFPSIMQGLQAEESIINSLEKIYENEDFFDIVVIIRGGGSQADLSCFDNYLLAANIAQFPLPVLTGIGHEKDESIVDIVANKKLKTPTAVAEFIIERTNLLDETLNELKNNISNLFFDELNNENNKLTQYTKILVPTVKNSIDKQKYSLNLSMERFKHNVLSYLKHKRAYLLELNKNLPAFSKFFILKNSEKLNSYKNYLKSTGMFLLKRESLALNNSANRLTLLDPASILKRGYSITYFEGQVVKDSKQVKVDDEIKTKLFSGSIRSKIEDSRKNN